MIYNVAQLMKATVATTQDVALDDEDHLDVEDDAVQLAGPITGHLRLHRTNQGIFASGTVHAPVQLECTRCLRELTTTLDFPLREEFFPTIDVVTGLPVNEPHDDDAFPIDKHHLLDTREAIRQNLLLALPVRVLCREDCAGLCPTCGHDLNEGPCSCEPETGDERFAVLRGLLADGETSEA